MSLIATALKHMLAAGMPHDAIVLAVEAMEAAAPVATPRSKGAERQARYEERKRQKASESVSSDATDVSSSEPLPLPSSPPAPPQLPTPARGEKTRTREGGEIEQAFAGWNILARQLGLPIAKDLTADRRKAIAARLSAGPEAWDEALAGVAKSRHCRGENDRNWKADLDFVCQPKSFNRLREGFYGTDAKPIGVVAGASPPVDPWPGRLREFARNGHWNTVDWGPRPGKPNCRAPPDQITEHCPTIAKDRAA